jgi:hypothetical protein
MSENLLSFFSYYNKTVIFFMKRRFVKEKFCFIFQIYTLVKKSTLIAEKVINSFHILDLVILKTNEI